MNYKKVTLIHYNIFFEGINQLTSNKQQKFSKIKNILDENPKFFSCKSRPTGTEFKIRVKKFEFSKIHNFIQYFIDDITKIGEINYDLGNFNEALEIFNIGMEFENTFKISQEQKIMLIKNRGRCYYRLEKYQEAKKHFEASLKISNNSGNIKQKTLILNHLGAIDGILGDIEDANEKFNIGIELAEKNGFIHEKAKLLNSIGAFIYAALGNYTLSRKKYLEAYSIYKQLGDDRGELKALLQITARILYEEPTEIDLDLLNKALSLARKLKQNSIIAIILARIGFIKYRLGFYDIATEKITEALKLSENLTQNRVKMRCLLIYAEIIKEDNSEKAINTLKDAYKIAYNLRFLIAEARILKMLGKLFTLKNKYNFALITYNLSLVIYNQILININNNKLREDLNETIIDLKEIIDDTNKLRGKDLLSVLATEKMKIEENINNIKYTLTRSKQSEFKELSNRIVKKNKKYKIQIRIELNELKERLDMVLPNFRYEWENFLVPGVFNNLNPVSQNELLFMDILRYIFEGSTEICIFILCKVIERELREKIFSFYKKYYNNTLKKTQYKFQDPERERVFRNLFKKSIYPTLRQIECIFEDTVQIRSPKNISRFKKPDIKFFLDFLNFLGDENLDCLENFTTFSFIFSQQKYTFGQIRNQVAHGNFEQIFQNISKDIFESLRNALTIFKPQYLYQILSINLK